MTIRADMHKEQIGLGTMFTVVGGRGVIFFGNTQTCKCHKRCNQCLYKILQEMGKCLTEQCLLNSVLS